MKEFYKIGEISKLFDVEISTLRYYDKIGLVQPEKIDSNGYRLYSIDQFEIIKTILLMRSLDLSIGKIHELLSINDLSQFQSELKLQQKKLRQRIDELEVLDKTITVLCENCITFNDDCVTVDYLDHLYVLSQKAELDEEGFEFKNISDIYRNVDKEWTTVANIISYISTENFLKGHYHEYSGYGLISEHPPNSKNPQMSLIPAGHYICLNVTICQKNHFDIDEHYEVIKRYIVENNLLLNGDIIERNLFDSIDDTSNIVTHFIRLYVPVKYIEYNTGG